MISADRARERARERERAVLGLKLRTVSSH